MAHTLWDRSIYSGALNQYTYPTNKEVGSFLTFLQQVTSNKRIHLTDVVNWNMPWPDNSFDIYIVCAFGEFINEEFCHRIDREFADRNLILLTSQYYDPTDLKNFKIFNIEHLHTAARFFRPSSYIPLLQRPYVHATQSRHIALHKSLITQHLLQRFPDLQYTFCNIPRQEYQLETFREDLKSVLAMECSDQELTNIIRLHENPKEIPGDDWEITANYTQSQLFWTTESIFLSRENCPTAYLTEKTLKPIVSGSAWIVAGQQHSYRRIRALGFETFESEFGIDFDDTFDRRRLLAIYDIADCVDFDHVLSQVELQQKIDYNYNYFFGSFVQHVEKQNLPKIQNFIDYVNSI